MSSSKSGEIYSYLSSDQYNLHITKPTQYLRDFLQRDLPRSNVHEISNATSWQFVLDKNQLSSKQKKKKRCIKKTFLTRKERKSLNLLKLPKDKWSSDSLKRMQSMWLSYIKENLSLITKSPSCIDPDWNSFSTVLAKSELIGAVVTIIRSKVPNQIGMTGTVVLETKLTFQIVTPQSQLKTIIKETSVFEFWVDSMKFTLFGKHISTRPSERSVKKIKGPMIPDL